MTQLIITRPHLNPYTQVINQAKRNPTTHKIVTSQKWSLLVASEKGYEINQLQPRLRNYINLHRNLINIIKNLTPLTPWFSETLLNHPITGTGTMDIHNYEYLTSPEILDSKINDTLRVGYFLNYTLHKIGPPDTEQPRMRPPGSKQVRSRYSNEQKEKILTLFKEENLHKKIETNFHLLTELVGEIWAPTTKRNGFIRESKPRANTHERNKWQKDLIKYYTQQLQLNPNILDIPAGYTIKPAIISEKSYTPPKITYSSHIKNTSPILPQPHNTALTTLPKMPDIALNSSAPSETLQEVQTHTQPTNQKILFPETTTDLYHTLNTKYETLQQIYHKLTPEQQHTLDTLCHTHIPQTLNTLGTLIQIDSPDITEATTHTNEALTETTQTLNNILTTFNQDTLQTLKQETQTIHNIIHTTQ